MAYDFRRYHISKHEFMFITPVETGPLFMCYRYCKYADVMFHESE